MARWGKQPRDDWEISAVQDRFIRATGGLGSAVQNIFGWWEPARPVVISEVEEEPQTWGELEALEPELFEPILETRPGLPPDPYPQPSGDDWYDPTEDDMGAFDWGTAISGVIDIFQGQNPGGPTGYAPPVQLPTPPGTGTVLRAPVVSGDACDGMAWSGGVPPKGYKVVNHCGVGVLRRIRRRRRPRIATNSDLADISAIVGIVGKGQLATALISRRGR